MLNNYFSAPKNIPNGLLKFYLSGKEYCLDIRYVLTILTPRIEKSFGVLSSSNKRFIKYHKESFPIINLDPVHQNKSNKSRLPEHILLVSVKEKYAAFFADRIVEFMTLSEKYLSSFKEIHFSEVNSMIDKLECDETSFLIINISKALELDESDSNCVIDYVQEKDNCSHANYS